MATPARLLGPDGQPITARDLAREVAAPVAWGPRSTPRDAVASGLTPEGLALHLRDAGGHGRRYLTLAEEMEESYLHYAARFQTRRLAFEALPVALDVPKGVPTRIVDAVQALVDGPAFREACADLTGGLGKGYSVVEPVWEWRDGLLEPVAYRHRDPRFFQFDRVSLSELRLGSEDGFGEGEPLPAGRFIVHAPRTRAGLPIPRGLARAAAWAFLLQSFALEDWAAFAEAYGLPIRVGKYHVGASEEGKRSLLRGLRMIASDAAP